MNARGRHGGGGGRGLALVLSLVASGAAWSAAGAAQAAAKPAGKVGSVRTVFLPSPKSPLVAIRLYFRLGSVDDPAGKEGLASLTSDVVGQGGTKARTYAEVLDALYPLAADIRVIIVAKVSWISTGA